MYARVYGHTTTAIHEIECISPIEYTPPPLGAKNDSTSFDFNLVYVRVNTAPHSVHPHSMHRTVRMATVRGDVAMVMTAESMDLRKLADGSGGGLPQSKIRKYASEMASVMR